ncbi:MAG: SCP2 sterol-binding domain-containing protein [Aigarchaeota archaeon]|nr:SCP2 sterol-binding domain-containing protein [Aigarchaeota archaeon]MDW8092128.1 SCP2 sterol-binding domain-containing protein [Nitrososphaerota archaeon]
MSELEARLRELVERVKSNPSALKTLTETEKKFLFKPTDGEPFFLRIKGPNIEVVRGVIESPTVTIIAKSGDMLDVFAGKADPVTLFLSGRLKVQGKVLEAQELARLLRETR